mmetsp:Transcript_19548/g.34688  ORF Transcript_19548/g.34688 Transcript_19548/m.34688 type:complete len:114 (-) Transcript_19548:355-696(-)
MLMPCRPAWTAATTDHRSTAEGGLLARHSNVFQTVAGYTAAHRDEGMQRRRMLRPPQPCLTHPQPPRSACDAWLWSWMDWRDIPLSALVRPAPCECHYACQLPRLASCDRVRP